MTCTLGACAGEGGSLVGGIFPICIVCFFSFLGGFFGGALGDLFCLGYMGIFLVH